MATIKRSVKLPIGAAEAFALVQESDTLVFVSDGLTRFGAKDEFPDLWNVGEKYRSEIFLFGFIPLGLHEFTFIDIDPECMVLKTNEAGGLVKRWDHEMFIVPIEDSKSCWYTDCVEVEAGFLTPLVGWFANRLYSYRQKRWLKLIEHEACLQNVR